MQYNISRLTISDLNYCELATEEEAEIKGGFLPVRGLPLESYLTGQTLSLLAPELEGYGRRQIYSGQGTVVNELANPTTGSKGVEVLNNIDNEKSHSVVLTGNNSITAFSTSGASNLSSLLST